MAKRLRMHGIALYYLLKPSQRRISAHLSQQRLHDDEHKHREARFDYLEHINDEDHFRLAFHKRFEK